MESAEYLQLVNIAGKLKGGMQKRVDWGNSPFSWIHLLSSRKRGKFGEDLVGGWLEANGFSVRQSYGSESDLLVGGCKTEIKMSTLWDSGVYTFQQIRDQDYEVLICLGISPNAAHLWVTRKSDIVWEELRHQHGGKAGKDTWWISFKPPMSPHQWLHPQNGDLSGALEELKKVVKSLKG